MGRADCIGVWAVLALVGLLGCNTSATEREKGIREIRDMERIHRDEDENRQRGIAIKKEDAMLDALLHTQFGHDVQPGVGCDVCPEYCERVDLRPMAPDIFKAYVRELVDATRRKQEPEYSLAGRDWFRLMCMTKVSGAPLSTALRALMEPAESPDVRLEAAFYGVVNEIYPERGYEVLNELGRGGEEDAAITACGYLEDFKLGLWLDDDLELD